MHAERRGPATALLRGQPLAEAAGPLVEVSPATPRASRPFEMTRDGGPVKRRRGYRLVRTMGYEVMLVSEGSRRFKEPEQVKILPFPGQLQGSLP
jgi:hypothetical protein